MFKSLNGDWQLNSTNNKYSCTANVPTSDFCALMQSGLIDDPLYSGDEQYAISIAKNDFTFSRTFTITQAELNNQKIFLECDKLDTLCTCYINGNQAFVSQNSYLTIKHDIKEYLKEGENEIKLSFASSYNYIVDRYSKAPLMPNSNGVNGIPYIRKPGCHFGWDWGPCVPFNYVGNIGLSFVQNPIENLTITQRLESGKAYISVKATNAKKCHINTPDGKTILPTNDFDFVIDNPQLWYTWDLSEKQIQPLYQVVISNDEEIISQKIGIRTVKLNQEKDAFGSNFVFEVNGKQIFAKGANLIPFSALTHNVDYATIDYYLDLAVKGGFNMIRVWGGGSYAGDYLLARCDQLGILVWQDFCFACQLYPLYEEDFVSNVLQEVKQNVSRMTVHPSLCLWCGNNEIETMFSYLPKTTKLIKSYIEFFYTTLPNFIKDLTDVDYIPTSPIGSAPFKDYSADAVGDTHMWNVWHGLKNLKYYQTRYSRFLSEYGLESLPSMAAINTFATEKDYDLKSKAFMSHQKCIGGNEKMMFYLTEMFDFPKHFADIPYLTGIVQAECVKNATEHFRRNRGRCNGSLFWQFNDVWNAPSWSAVDFLGVPKALMYKAAYFNAPEFISYDGKSVYAHNDTLQDKQFDITVKIHLNDKIVSVKNISKLISAQSVQIVDSISIPKGAVMQIVANNKQFVYYNNPKLKKANITVDVNGNIATVTSDTFAKDVMLDIDGVASDNYFCLFAGESVQISLDAPLNDVKVKCVNNIEFKHQKIKKALFRLFYRLKPLNIGNAFYYQFN